MVRLKHYGLFVGGKWVKSNSGETFKSLNPASEKCLGVFSKGNARDVKKAINAAARAFPEWSAMPAPKRGAILLKAAQLLRERKQELGRLVTQEMGKVLKEGLSDVQEAIDTFEYFAGEGRRLYGNTTTSELPDKFAMTVRIPVGVCSLITPWNFPIAIPAWKIAPALVCGNTIVFKPSTDTPLCAIRLVEILEEIGLPKGVVNLVLGSGSDVGKEMIVNEKVQGVSFTGSRETGEWIEKNAGLKKVGLELGGKNAIIVMDDADLKLAVDGIVWSAFSTSGQRCTACSRLIVHEKVERKLLELLLKKVKKLKLGNGLNARTDIGPLVNEAAVEKVSRHVEIGRKEKARLMCGGSAVKIKGRGFFFQPTIFSNVKPKSSIALEEIFGPVLAVIKVRNFKEAIKVCNESTFGLSSAIFTESIPNAFKAVQEIQAGLTYVNSGTIGSEVHLPFGGVKGSGHTREAGIKGIEEFSQVKTVYFDYSGKLQKVQMQD